MFWACPLAKAVWGIDRLFNLGVSYLYREHFSEITKDSIMDVKIGQVTVRFTVSEDVTTIRLEIPVEFCKLVVGIRHAPKSPSGQVFSISVGVEQKPKPYSLG